MRNLWEQMTFPLLHGDMSSQQITDKLSLLPQIKPTLVVKRKCWKAKVKWCLLLFWWDLAFRSKVCKIQVQKYQGGVNSTYTRDPAAPHYQNQLPPQINRNFSARILPREIKNNIKNRALTWVCLGASFRGHFISSMFQCLFVFLFQVFLLPWRMKHHRFFTQFSDTLRMGLLE